MNSQFNERVQSLITEFLDSKSNQLLIVVLKGFDCSIVTSLRSDNGIMKIQSLKELHGNRNEFVKGIMTEIVMPRSAKPFIVISYEEYLLLNKGAILPFVDIKIIWNNLYDHLYPMIYDDENIGNIVRYFDDDEKGDDFIKEYEYVFDFYGDVKQTETGYYVSYINRDEEEMIPLFKDIVPLKMIESDADKVLELSQNDYDFLDFTNKILNNRYERREIAVVVHETDDLSYENYKDRIGILSELTDYYDIAIIRKRTEPEKFDDIPYREILKKYWGYDNFKRLKNYRMVDYEISRELIDIPQSQIIHDLVTQALNSYHSLPYKDIFVTAPTGAGKSVMFQIPAIYLAEKYKLLTIVISPLIGLMMDQVQSLVKKTLNISATINSTISPVEKLDILEKIKDGSVSILYISPETLLSRADIQMLIANRKLGLIIIDEAHIVTTWGKAFRSDYWYLGTYLNKLRKQQNFPIATFTATAIYGGVEDMYKETKDSLYMKNPISYFGYVKRDNIDIKIRKLTDETSFKEYKTMKNKILSLRLKFNLDQNEKTLVYFPTITLIDEFYAWMMNNGDRNVFERIAKYYGPMDKMEKQESYEQFLNGTKQVMLATKAFGMGIDIPDIHNVYHFAPTGNVCDFVQEIGRAARSLERGKAYFDYLVPDFVHVKRLHGISAMRKNQLVQIVKKVLSIMDMKKQNQRNFVIDPESFSQVFKIKEKEGKSDELSNRLKIGLLLLEKDFTIKYGFSPIVARPQNIFEYESFKFAPEVESKVAERYSKYMNKVDEYNGESIYRFNMKQLWEEKFEKKSYPEFKYMFHTRNPDLKLEYIDLFAPVLKIEVVIKQPVQAVKKKFDELISKVEHILGDMFVKQSFFTEKTITDMLPDTLFRTRFVKDEFAHVLLMVLETYDRNQKIKSNFYHRFVIYEESRNAYKINSNNYSEFIKWCRREFGKLFNNAVIESQQFSRYYPKFHKEALQDVFLTLGLLETAELLGYVVTGGDNAQVFIRVNSRYQLEKIVSNPESYYNTILNNVHIRHKMSVEMLTWLFKQEVNTEQFWHHIENYFFGVIPDEVQASMKKTGKGDTTDEQ